MTHLPLNFYRVQWAYLMFASVASSFSLFLVWYFTSNGWSPTRLGLVLGFASLMAFLQFVYLSFRSIRTRERTLSLRLCLVAIVVVLVAFVSRPENAIFLAMAAVWLSLCDAFIKTASVAIIPQTSSQEHSATAFSHRTAMFSFERLLGPMFAGAILSLFGSGGYFMGAIISLVVVFACFMQSDFGSNTSKAVDEKSRLNGFNLLWGVKTELWIAVISAIFNFAFSPFLGLVMPLVVLEKLALSPLYVGVLDGAFAAGLFVESSYVVNFANSAIGSRFSMVVGGVAISLAILSFTIIEAFYLLLGVQALAGLGLSLFNVNATKIRCMATPVQYRSKLESSFMLTCMSTIPIGMWFFGILSAFETQDVALMISGGCLLAASLLVLAVPYLSSLAGMTGDTLDGAYARVYPELFVAD